MEKFSQFRDRGMFSDQANHSWIFLAGHADQHLNRLGHRAVPPHSIRATWPAGSPSHLPILLPLASLHICHIDLFSGPAMAPHRFSGQEGSAVVYTWRAQHLVD